MLGEGLAAGRVVSETGVSLLLGPTNGGWELGLCLFCIRIDIEAPLASPETRVNGDDSPDVRASMHQHHRQSGTQDIANRAAKHEASCST